MIAISTHNFSQMFPLIWIRYGVPNEEPEVAGAQPLNKRCGSNALHCDSELKNLASAANCNALIGTLTNGQFSNTVIPNGLRSTCVGKNSGKCCVAFQQNLSGTGTRWGDLVGAAFDVFHNCPRTDNKWVSGWTTDTLLGGKCGNQCLSAGISC